jgi:YHS domain-containing protein
MPETSSKPSGRRLGLAALVVLVALIAGLSYAASEGKAKSNNLKRVETKKVCMINNQIFEKDQIPVEVQGRTYYGCCEMCKERLANDAASRTAVDPVSGKEVDKAKAVIAAKPDGSVLYFESEESMEKYEGE